MSGTPVRPKVAAARHHVARRPPAIFWTERALSDLESIHDYITRDNPRAADAWIAKLMVAVEKAAAAPLAARQVPELGRRDVREVLLRTYRIVYRVSARRLEVLTVFEGHRLFPEDWNAAE